MRARAASARAARAKHPPAFTTIFFYETTGIRSQVPAIFIKKITG
jgi:hypothetical protein